MSHHDLVVVGGGTAGIVASLSAAAVGARVVLVEEDRTGGDCLWRGCVPSKALLAAARRAHEMRTADAVGIAPVEPEIDLDDVMAHVRDAQAAIAPDDSPERLRGEGVTVLHGHARFTGPDRLVVEEDGGGRRALTFRRALIATGSRPVIPPIDGVADLDVLTSDTVWDLSVLPERLLVVGGGPVGCELAQAFRRLGTAVTLVEMTPELLPAEEPEACELLARRLTDEGVDVRLATTVEEVCARGDGRRAELVPTGGPAGAGDAGREHTSDRVLLAAGRRPVTAGLGLSAAGVETDDAGAVVIDDRMRTSSPRVWAAGDVTDQLPFTHFAGHQGATAAANALFGLRRTVDPETTPWVTFTDPEVARVGLSEAEAGDRFGDGISVETVTHDELDRAVTVGRTEGFTKLVADPRGRLVGGTVVGPSAGETIAEVVSLAARRARLSDAGQLVHAYPTFSEAVGRAGTASLRGQLENPAVRVFTRTVLWILRHVDRLRT